MIKKLISTGKRKAFLLTAIFFSLVVISLGITPNYSCGCGDVENGTKLTYLINGISKSLIGKKIIETGPNPENAN